MIIECIESHLADGGATKDKRDRFLALGLSAVYSAPERDTALWVMLYNLLSHHFPPSSCVFASELSAIMMHGEPLPRHLDHARFAQLEPPPSTEAQGHRPHTASSCTPQAVLERQAGGFASG